MAMAAVGVEAGVDECVLRSRQWVLRGCTRKRGVDGDDERSMAFHHVGVFRNDEWDGGV